MPDIFGRSVSNYEHYLQVSSNDIDLSQYLTERAHTAGHNNSHDFNAMRPRLSGQRADMDSQAVGYITDNLQSIQGMIDEIMYTDYRLPEFIPIFSDVPEGALTYSYRVIDRVGLGRFIDNQGTEAPNATVTQRIVPYPLHYAGIVPEWTLEDLRRSMLGGIALDSETVVAATTGALDHIEQVGLSGDSDRQLHGLINLPVDSSDPNAVQHSQAGRDYDSADSDHIVTELQNEVLNIITTTREVFGRNFKSGLCIYMPIEQAAKVMNARLPDLNMSVWQYFSTNNAWTNYTGEVPMLKWVQELSGAGQDAAGNSNDSDRMIIAINDRRVMEMAMPITPRPISTLYEGYRVCVPLEYKISGLNVKRPQAIRYVDGI